MLLNYVLVSYFVKTMQEYKKKIFKIFNLSHQFSVLQQHLEKNKKM